MDEMITKSSFLAEIADILEDARKKAKTAVNLAMVYEYRFKTDAPVLLDLCS